MADENCCSPRPMAPYQQPIAAVLAGLRSDGRSGLSQPEATERLKRYGDNELTSEKPMPEWRKFLSQFADMLVLLLIVAGAVSTILWFFERDSALPYEAIAIFAIVLLNAVMAYFQEARAEQAIAALRQISAAQTKVIRDGERRSISSSERCPRRYHSRRGRRHRSSRRATHRIGRPAVG